MAVITWGQQTWGSHVWGGSSEEEAIFSIYPMLMLGVRIMDEQSLNILKKFTLGLDIAWEDLIYDRCTELPTLFEIDNIDSKWLKYLKALLGFTQDLSFEATDAELRKILKLAVLYWNEKPSELGVINYAIRMVTGNRFRTANYFDLRAQSDQSLLTEELEDFDPNMIDFGSDYFTGVNGLILTSDTFQITDLPLSDGFVYPDQFKYLVIQTDLTDGDNENFYEIDYLNTTLTTGKIKGSFNSVHANTVEWKLLGFMAENTTEVRLVDEGTGKIKYDNLVSAFTPTDKLYGMTSGATALILTDSNNILNLRNVKGRFIDNETIKDVSGGEALVNGKLYEALNRDLLNFLMSDRTVLPLGERIDLIYSDFLDQFITVNDLDQWTATSGVTVPSPGGAAVIPVGESIVYTHSVNLWQDLMIRYKFQVDTAGTIARLKFYYQNATNYYEVEVNYTTKTVRLLAYPGPVVLSSVTLSYLLFGVQDVVRVETVVVSGTANIKIKVNGNLEIDTTDATYTNGGISIASSSGTTRLKLAEVYTLPIDIDRIGPNP